MAKKKTEDPIPLVTTRNLGDKLYDKRKLGALEIEGMVKELIKIKDSGKIAQIIQFIKGFFF